MDHEKGEPQLKLAWVRKEALAPLSVVAFASNGYHGFAAGRTEGKLSQVVKTITFERSSAESCVMDATDKKKMLGLFDLAMPVTEDREPADVVVFNSASLNRPNGLSRVVVQ